MVAELESPTGRITTVVEVIGPGRAQELLSRNSRNRRVKSGRVAQFAGAMRRGEWSLNGESIKLSRNGVLLDGQNRLLAIVEAGVPVETVVVYGLEENAQETVDMGTRRSFADILTMRGEAQAKDLASAVGALHRYLNDYEVADVRLRGYGGGLNTAQSPTSQQLLAVLDAHPGLRDGMPVANQVRKQIKVQRGLTAALYYIFRQIDEVDAETFFARLADGKGLEDGDPILVLRKTIIRDAMATHPSINRGRLWALTVKAWNFWRNGDRISLLRFQPGGSAKESFPKPA